MNSKKVGGKMAQERTSMRKIKEVLRKQFKSSMKIDDCLKLGLAIFKEIKGKNFNIDNFDAAFVLSSEKERKVQRVSGEKLKKHLK